jgi:hypothetical protein
MIPNKKILIVDNNMDNSDWVKANAFDFPRVVTVEDFERQFGVPSDEPARSESLAKLRTFPWAQATPKPIYDLLFADALEKVSFGGDRSEAGRYAANMRWKNNVKTKATKAPNITKELKTYFGDTQKRYEQSEGWKEVQKRQIRNHITGQFAEDFRLEIIAEKQGFTGKPKVVTAQEMNQLEKEGWTIAYRGISDAFEEGSDSEEGRIVKSADLAQQFLEGDYFAGYGSYGNGIYCAILKETAENYAAQGDTKGTVLKIAIPPDSVMSSEQFQEQVKNRYETKIVETTLDFWGDDDLGRHLSAKGFRGARVKSISSPAEILVIWDRSMLAVQELDTTK